MCVSKYVSRNIYLSHVKSFKIKIYDISTLDISTLTQPRNHFSSLDISTCVQTLGSLLGVSGDIRGGLTELGSRRREHGRPEPELRREVRTQAFKMSANKRL